MIMQDGWITVADLQRLERHLAFDILDALGRPIRRGITRYNPATGEVESVMYDVNGNPKTYWTLFMGSKVKLRREFYPAPLTYKRVSCAYAEASIARYLDRVGL